MVGYCTRTSQAQDSLITRPTKPLGQTNITFRALLMSRIKDIVHNITIRCPGFAEFWPKERSWHTDQQGQISLCGVFEVLTAYMNQQGTQLRDDQLRELWEWIEWQSTSSDEDLSTAAVTCFLENVADTDVELYSKPFMPPSLVKWFDEFLNRGHRKKRWFES